MPNTAFELQMIIRIMMAPDKKSRPSAAELLTRRQLLSDEQRQLIVERNKAEAANMALDAQMVRSTVLLPPCFHAHATALTTVLPFNTFARNALNCFLRESGPFIAATRSVKVLFWSVKCAYTIVQFTRFDET